MWSQVSCQGNNARQILAANCQFSNQNTDVQPHHCSIVRNNTASYLPLCISQFSELKLKRYRICHEMETGKARRYLCSIKQFDFITALCATEHVLANTVTFSNMLQGKSINLLETLKEAKVVKNLIMEEKKRPDGLELSL